MSEIAKKRERRSLGSVVKTVKPKKVVETVNEPVEDVVEETKVSEELVTKPIKKSTKKTTSKKVDKQPKVEEIIENEEELEEDAIIEEEEVAKESNDDEIVTNEEDNEEVVEEITNEEDTEEVVEEITNEEDNEEVVEEITNEEDTEEVVEEVEKKTRRRGKKPLDLSISSKPAEIKEFSTLKREDLLAQLKYRLFKKYEINLDTLENTIKIVDTLEEIVTEAFEKKTTVYMFKRNFNRRKIKSRVYTVPTEEGKSYLVSPHYRMSFYYENYDKIEGVLNKDGNFVADDGTIYTQSDIDKLNEEYFKNDK